MRAGSKQPKVKASVYLTETGLEEMKLQARRLQRDQSWLIRTAWEIAKERISKMEAPPVL